jgi:hypothetical protein
MTSPNPEFTHHSVACVSRQEVSERCTTGTVDSMSTFGVESAQEYRR